MDEVIKKSDSFPPFTFIILQKMMYNLINKIMMVNDYSDKTTHDFSS